MDAQSRLVDDLNPAQREAVTTVDGPLLVVAGAGSGKTRVITRRIAYLIAGGVPASNILAVTFTNKAAKEMQARVAALSGSRGALLATFHGFGARLLRQEAARLGLASTFSLYDRGDSEAVIKKILKEMQLDAESHPPTALLEAISEWKARLVGVRDAADAAVTGRDEVDARVYAAYEDALKRSGALDFDDLIEKSIRLLEEHPDCLAAVRQKFRYLLVDEYQDVNFAQYRLTRLIADGSRNLCVTGDPDQCIYSWRGADIGYILGFAKDYPDAKTVKLEQNYRSVNTILKAASAVIRFNSRRADKELWSDKGDGAPIVIHRVADDIEEARVVAERIRTLRGQGTHLSDIAVFYRLNSLSLPLEQALIAARVPYQVLHGLEFFKRKEVKDVVAYLRFIANPDDEVSLRRIINVPPRGLGEKTVEAIEGIALREGLSLGATVMRRELWRGRFAPRAAKALDAFADVAADLAELRDDPRAGAVIERVLVETGYASHLTDKGTESGADPLGNIQQLGAAARRYDQNPDSRGLLGFLEEISLQTDTDGYDTDADKVALMTVHAAKGLEFPHVFIVGMDQDLFPHRGMGRAADEEEERRLFYVGITRAMTTLTLLTAQARLRFGRTTFAMHSLFLTEIPEELTEVMDHSSGVKHADVSRQVAYEPDETPGIRKGARVRHKSFGQGVIVAIRGRGADAVVTVRFVEAGERRLVLAFAGLTVMDEDYA